VGDTEILAKKILAYSSISLFPVKLNLHFFWGRRERKWGIEVQRKLVQG